MKKNKNNKNISKCHHSLDTEVDFFWEHISDCLEEDKNILTSVFIVVHGKDGNHANFVIIETFPQTKHIRVIIFDPHAEDSEYVRDHKTTWETILTTKVQSQIITSFEILTPFLVTSIQKTEGICLHWAIVIGLTYKKGIPP